MNSLTFFTLVCLFVTPFTFASGPNPGVDIPPIDYFRDNDTLTAKKRSFETDLLRALFNRSPMVMAGVDAGTDRMVISEMAEKLYGEISAQGWIQFDPLLQDEFQIGKLIYGERVQDPRSLYPAMKMVSSEFMKMYDRDHGNFIFVIDFAHTSNPSQISINNIVALVQMIKGYNPHGFIDGIYRPLDGVRFIINTSFGYDLYGKNFIPPNNLYDDTLMRRGSLEVYDRFINDESSVKSKIINSYSRRVFDLIGRDNFIFLPPADSLAIRKTFLANLNRMIIGLRPTPGSPGWYLAFKNRESFEKIVDALEVEAFRFWQQLGGVQYFVRVDLEDQIKRQLLNERVESGTQVMLELAPQSLFPTVSSGLSKKHSLINLYAFTEGKRVPILIKITGRPLIEREPRLVTADIATAYREVGRVITKKFFFADGEQSKRPLATTKLSLYPRILPTDTDTWLSIKSAVAHGVDDFSLTSWDLAAREIAVLLSGAIVDELIHTGLEITWDRHLEIPYFADIAFSTVMQMKYGRMIDDKSVKPFDYFMHLTASEKKSVDKMVDRLISEGHKLGKSAVLSNWDLISNLSSQLLKDGSLSITDNMLAWKISSSKFELLWRTWSGSSLQLRLESLLDKFNDEERRKVELKNNLLIPSQIMDRESYLSLERERSMAADEIDKIMTEVHYVESGEFIAAKQFLTMDRNKALKNLDCFSLLVNIISK